jgi:GntR family transcriptional regulator
LHSFSEEIEHWGYRPGARLISRSETTADAETAEHLELEPGAEVLCVRRLRLADERPIFVCDSRLPVARFPALRDADYGVVSLSRLLEESTGRRVERARQWIEAAPVPPDVAELLEIDPGKPALRIRRVTLVADDAPVEFVEAFFHPERYRHYNELTVQTFEVGG